MISEKKESTAFVLCLFLGLFGAHRFYVGKTGTAVIQFLTFGGCVVWTLVDLIMIAIGEFTDNEGVLLRRY